MAAVRHWEEGGAGAEWACRGGARACHRGAWRKVEFAQTVLRPWGTWTPCDTCDESEGGDDGGTVFVFVSTCGSARTGPPSAASSSTQVPCTCLRRACLTNASRSGPVSGLLWTSIEEAFRTC